MANRYAAAVAGLLVVLSLASGCTSPAPAEVPVEAPQTAAPQTAAPDVPADRPRESTSIELPRLPVGGDSQPVSGRDGLSCVTVSWIVDPEGPAGLAAGIEIRVRRVSFEPTVFQRVRARCAADLPDCVGYTFSASSGAPACGLAVWTDTPGATASVLLQGVVRCQGVSTARCAAFVRAAASQPSQLQVTDQRPVEESATPSPDSSGG